MDLLVAEEVFREILEADEADTVAVSASAQANAPPNSARLICCPSCLISGVLGCKPDATSERGVGYAFVDEVSGDTYNSRGRRERYGIARDEAERNRLSP